MKLIVFGATGTLGRVLVAHALKAGHAVTAFTRSGDFPHARHRDLRVARGDALDAGAVAAAMPGHDAALCALGAGRKGGVRAQGTANILAAMQAAGVRRLVCLTTLGAGDSAGNLNFFWKHIMFGLLLRPAMADHEAQEDAIRASDRDWTILRPAAFTDGPATGRVRHGFSGDGRNGLALKISRADVADFMLAQLEDATYLRRAASLSY